MAKMNFGHPSAKPTTIRTHSYIRRSPSDVERQPNQTNSLSNGKHEEANIARERQDSKYKSSRKQRRALQDFIVGKKSFMSDTGPT